MLPSRSAACPSAEFLGSGYTDADMREALAVLMALAVHGYTKLYVAAPQR